MSDTSISIVPRLSTFPNKELKAAEILDWLVSINVVKPQQSDCVLGSEYGYQISDGAKEITNEPRLLPFSLITNGLEIVTQRQMFHTGQNEIEKLLCPSCKQDISREDLEFINEWDEEGSNNITCPLCNSANDIHTYSFSPRWGFSDLGFTFWNWPNLSENFIDMFKQRLNSEINIVYARL